MAKHHELVEPFAIHPAAFVGSTDPATDPDNDVQVGAFWVDTTSGFALKKRNATDDGWDTLTNSTVAPPAVVKTETASYPLVLADAGKWIRMNVASANDLTVPDNADVAFPIGTEIHIEQMGAGQVTIVEDTAVTVNTPETLKLAKQFAVATLKKVATDEWTLAGYLEAAP